MGIVLISVIPVVFEVLKARKESKEKAAEAPRLPPRSRAPARRRRASAAATPSAEPVPYRSYGPHHCPYRPGGPPEAPGRTCP